MGHSLSQKRCIVNLGLYKTGTSTLTKAADSLDMKAYNDFPNLANSHTLKDFLVDPARCIDNHVYENLESFVDFFVTYDFVSDGWFSLLPLASQDTWEAIRNEVKRKGVQLIFIATERSLETYLTSELHQWVRYDIEKKADLSVAERSALKELLSARYQLHAKGVLELCETEHVTRLNLRNHDKWAEQLAAVSDHDWHAGLHEADVQNRSPDLPLEGILLTMRILQNFEKCLKDLELLLDSIERDSLCNYMLVLALDDDEFDTQEAVRIKDMLGSRHRLKALHVLRNPSRNQGDPPKICQIWATMAECAWENGASWVVFLGDDVRIESSFHYRAIYRYFLDNQVKFNLPEGSYFGCPWFDDEGFKGFPTFPIVGKEHFEIFKGLIPAKHRSLFVNQDLDPYLQRIYLKFGAAPMLDGMKLTNGAGGSDMTPARYARVRAINWRDRILEENICVAPVQAYLEQFAKPDLVQEQVLLLVDVVIPSYRIDLKYLQRLCSIAVPSYMRTTFIIIIDNPSHLVTLFDDENSNKKTPQQAASMLERRIVESSGTCNNIRVRCNETNEGASASRNRGIKESAAEYILFLDDDVIPEKDILHSYGKELKSSIANNEPILGLLGLVRFPREANMTIFHAGILMSYLVFSFELAEGKIYSNPAWGVTANILYKKFANMSFDIRYAKTGGGEDVDFALRLSKENGNVALKCCPSAKVTHLFWSDRIVNLCKHFFNWAIGDGALFYRFEDSSLVYSSYPNFAETYFILLPPCCAVMDNITFRILPISVIMFFCDVIVDMVWNFSADYKHRLSLLEKEVTAPFSVLAHAVANFYVVVLETGRLYGHLKRGHVRNIFRRFDWHCGRLEHSKQRFIQREKVKFLSFVLVVSLVGFTFEI